jgi:hypothetical protein
MSSDGKVGPGQKIQSVPHGRWNSAIDAGIEYDARRLGNQGPPGAIPTTDTIVKVRNSTGTDRALGDCICLDDFALDDIVQGYLWFDGKTPTTAHKPYGILLEPIPDGDFGRVMLSGVCAAKIDNVYDDHPFAHITDGENQLETNWCGQAEILFRQEVGEQWWAVVRLSNMQSTILDVVVSQGGGIPFGSNGSASVKWAGVLTDPLQTIDILFDHVGSGRTLAVDTQAMVRWDMSRSKWCTFAADCP